MAEWVPDPIYREVIDRLLFDPLQNWQAPDLLARVDGWCEDRDPNTHLTNHDGRE